MARAVESTVRSVIVTPVTLAPACSHSVHLSGSAAADKCTDPRLTGDRHGPSCPPAPEEPADDDAGEDQPGAEGDALEEVVLGGDATGSSRAR